LRPALFWAITQRVMATPHRRFGTTYRSLLAKSSVRNHHHKLLNSAEERVFHLLRGGSLKSPICKEPLEGRSARRYSSTCRGQQKYRVKLYASTPQMCFETAILVSEQVKNRTHFRKGISCEGRTLLLNLTASLLVMLIPCLRK
jgi:hypothetical protein